MSENKTQERAAKELFSLCIDYGDNKIHTYKLMNRIESICAALSAPKQAGEPARYFAGGPQGHFFADDLQLARDLVNLYDKQDDWTITDLQNPTGPSSPQAAPVLVEVEATRRPTDDELWDQTLRERDEYHEMADDLAAQIAAITGVDIGEHSSTNCPWREAMLAADDFIAKQIRDLCDKLESTPPSQPAVELGSLDHEISVWAGRMSSRDMLAKYPEARAVHSALVGVRIALIDGAKVGRVRGVECTIAGWIHEDQLPEGYPYDKMFPFSGVDFVRIFPVYVPIRTTPVAAPELDGGEL